MEEIAAMTQQNSENARQANSLVGETFQIVKELVAEIAAASQEQAQGVEQINRAIIEMGKMVQQNAANASESSSTSEQLGEQAQQMTLVVEDLVALVGGTGSSNSLHRQSFLVKLQEGWRSRKDRKSGETAPLALEGEEPSTPLVTHEAAPPPRGKAISRSFKGRHQGPLCQFAVIGNIWQPQGFSRRWPRQESLRHYSHYLPGRPAAAMLIMRMLDLITSSRLSWPELSLLMG